MSSSNYFKYEFHGSSSTDLNNIYTNNSNTVNPLLPFGVHIKGGVSVCVTKCGHTFSNSDNIKIENMINYGRILVMIPSKKNQSELKLHYDARNENADQNGSGKYKLKYICFTCPSTIKIGDIDSDMQSYLIYTNDNGLYTVVCTLYRNAAPVDNLANSLLSGLLNNNLPNKGASGGGSSMNINISDFLPQDKQDYYEFINSESNSQSIKEKILVKVYAKKVNISSVAINNLKQKLFDSNSNDTFNNFNDSLNSVFSVKPENINIFHVPDLGISKIESTKEKMANLNKKIDNDETEEEEYDVEEEMSVIEKLKKSTLEEKKESFIDFTDDLKIYKIDLKDGSTKKVFNNPDSSSSEKLVDYISYKELFIRNKDYDEDEIKRAINEFPNYIYKNSYWRVDYTLRLYKDNNEDDNSADFEIIDSSSIDEAVKKIEKCTNEEVFYSMKNFPNVPVNGYYVTYVYKSSTTQSMYIKMMYILFCVFILLFNFMYYRLIYNITNNDYGDVSIDDDEIINDENLKKLASWRLLLNLTFFIQIVATIFYSVLKMSNISENDSGFNFIFVISCILTVFSTLYYGYLRLHYNDVKVSYAEDKSLKLLLENNDKDEDDGIINYLLNSLQLMKNSLFYFESGTTVLFADFTSIFNELNELKEQIESSENLENDNVDKWSKKTDDIIEKIKPYLKANFNYNKNKRSRFSKNSQILLDTFKKIGTEIQSKLPTSNIKKVKTNAVKLISKLKKVIDKKEINNDNENNGNKEVQQEQQGGENKNEPSIVTGFKKNSNFNYNENDYETNKIIDGKAEWPNGNSFNNNDDGEIIEQSDFYENLLKIITPRNLFIYLVFIVVFLTILGKIKSIITTFDTTKNKDYATASGFISALSYMPYGGVLFGCFAIKFHEFYKWYFVGEEDENKNNIKNKNEGSQTGMIFMAFGIWMMIVLYGFNFEETSSVTVYWLITVLIFLGIQSYIIYSKVGTENWGKLIGFIVISLLVFVLPAGVAKTPTSYKTMLILTPIFIALTYYYLGSLLNLFTGPENVKINDPITFPNFDPNNINKIPIKTPMTIPDINELEKLGGLLEEMKAKGGLMKEKKNKLHEHVKHLTNLSEYFGKSGHTESKNMTEKILSEVQALTD